MKNEKKTKKRALEGLSIDIGIPIAHIYAECSPYLKIIKSEDGYDFIENEDINLFEKSIRPSLLKKRSKLQRLHSYGFGAMQKYYNHLSPYRSRERYIENSTAFITLDKNCFFSPLLGF